MDNEFTQYMKSMLHSRSTFEDPHTRFEFGTGSLNGELQLKVTRSLNGELQLSKILDSFFTSSTDLLLRSSVCSSSRQVEQTVALVNKPEMAAPCIVAGS